MPAEILKQDALVLKSHPASNTSRVVVWWTREAGRVTTLLKGAHRPRSPYLGRFDLFQTCELLYYARERNDLHHTREISCLAPRSELRRDWRSAVVASYAADLLARVSPPRIPHAALYDLVTAFWDQLASDGPDAEGILRFELAFLNALGFAPRLDGEDGDLFSPEEGGLVPNAKAGLRLSAPVLAHLRSLATDEEVEADVAPLTITKAHWRELREALGRFLRYHLEMPLESREIAFDLLERYPRSR